MTSETTEMKSKRAKSNKQKLSEPKYPGTPITTNGNQLVAYYT